MNVAKPRKINPVAVLPTARTARTSHLRGWECAGTVLVVVDGGRKYGYILGVSSNKLHGEERLIF